MISAEPVGVKMNNQNAHQFINALGQVTSAAADNPSNIHILNMFNAEAAQGGRTVIPQYAYQVPYSSLLNSILCVEFFTQFENMICLTRDN